MSNNPVVYGLTNPLQLIVGPPIEAERDPNSNDALNYPNGQQWMVSGTLALWELVLGTWTLIGNASTGDVQTLTGNSGGTVGPDMAGNIDVVGDGVTVDVVGSPGSNTLTISVLGSVADEFETDSGTAVPIAGVLQILGGTGIDTAGATNVVTINAAADVATTYDCDTGSATPAANVLEILGGTGCSTTASGNTVTIDVSSPATLTFTCDMGTAVPAMDNINIIGAGGATTSATGDTITITAGGGGSFTWNEVTGTSDTMNGDNGYIANNAAPVDLTLPPSAAVGEIIRVVGKGAGGWFISQNPSQQIFFLTDATTIGATGTLTPNESIAAIEMVCTTTDLEFTVLSGSGNFTLA